MPFRDVIVSCKIDDVNQWDRLQNIRTGLPSVAVILYSLEQLLSADLAWKVSFWNQAPDLMLDLLLEPVAAFARLFLACLTWKSSRRFLARKRVLACVIVLHYIYVTTANWDCAIGWFYRAGMVLDLLNWSTIAFGLVPFGRNAFRHVRRRMRGLGAVHSIGAIASDACWQAQQRARFEISNVLAIDALLTRLDLLSLWASNTVPDSHDIYSTILLIDICFGSLLAADALIYDVGRSMFRSLLVACVQTCWKKLVFRSNAHRVFDEIRRARGDDAIDRARGLEVGVYYPNLYDKAHSCQSQRPTRLDGQPHKCYNRLCTKCTNERIDSCDGDGNICMFTEAKGYHGREQCWRTSFRKHLNVVNDHNGIFLQVVDEDELGQGQKEEIRWATDLGMEVWHTTNGKDFVKGAWPGWALVGPNWPPCLDAPYARQGRCAS